jgi:hypothetical protein
MYYPMDAESCARTREFEWEREVAAMQRHEVAIATPLGHVATGNALGMLLVDAFATLRSSIPRRQARTA